MLPIDSNVNLFDVQMPSKSSNEYTASRHGFFKIDKNNIYFINNEIDCFVILCSDIKKRGEGEVDMWLFLETENIVDREEEKTNAEVMKTASVLRAFITTITKYK